jgi:hypothetical protein
MKKTLKREHIQRGVWFVGLSADSKQYAAIRCDYCGQGLRTTMTPGKRVLCPREDHPVAAYFVPADIAERSIKLSQGVHRSIRRKSFSFTEAKYAERLQETAT